MAERKLAKNTTYYTGALIIQKILAFVYFWLISNSLAQSSLGQYIFALSFTTMFSIIVDLGLSLVLTREATKSDQEANIFLKNVTALKIPLSIIALLLSWLIINITGKTAEIKTLIYIASVIMVLDSFSLSFWAIFRARQNLKYESIATILVQLIIFTLGYIALKTTGQVSHLMIALLGASVFNFVLAIIMLKIKLKFSLRPQWNKDIVMHFLKIVPAFAIAGIFVKIYNTADSVLLSYLSGDAAVGYFAVPAKVVYALQQIIPAGFAAVIFPAFSYYYCNSKELLSTTFLKAFRYLIIVSLPITAGLVTLVGPIIDTLWPSYRPIIPTFIIMSLAIPTIFLAFPTGYLLNACDRQGKTTINRVIITALAVVLNVILISRYSFLGAAITFLITNCLLLFLDFIWVKKIITLKLKPLLTITGKSLLASIIMVIVVLLTKNYLHLFVVAPLGAVIYFSVLLLLKGFSFKELRMTK